jgi:glycine cleavage system transcriptional repressor
MRHLAVSAVGGDRPGIVAGLTSALAELGCNLEDTSMTVLRGRFAMILVVAGPDALDASAIHRALESPADELGMAVWVHEVDEAVPREVEGDRWAVSVHGADRTGIVSALSVALAEAGVNIHDLATRLVGSDQGSYYAMLMEVVVPSGVDASDVSSRLSAVGAHLGVSVSMSPSSADVL